MAPSLGKVWMLACTSTAPVGLPAMRQEDTLVTQEVSPTPCTQGRCAPNRAGGMRDGTQGRCAPDKTDGTGIDPRPQTTPRHLCRLWSRISCWYILYLSNLVQLYSLSRISSSFMRRHSRSSSESPSSSAFQ